MKITAGKLILIALGLILAAWLVFRIIPSDENRIHRLIHEAAKAVEREDLDGVMGVISLSYRDSYGLTYAAWRALFQRGFNKYMDIRVWIRSLDIKVNGDEAEATFSLRVEATVAATTGDPDKLPTRDVGSLERAKLRFKREALGWRVVSGEERRPVRWGL